MLILELYIDKQNMILNQERKINIKVDLKEDENKASNPSTSQNKEEHEQDRQPSLFPKLRALFNKIKATTLTDSNLDGRDFIRSAAAIVNHLKEIKDLNSAIIIMNIEKDGILYHITFDNIFAKEGIPYKQQGFRVIDSVSIDLPKYILDEVASKGKMTVNFSAEDLDTLFAEKDSKIHSKLRFRDICNALSSKDIKSIRLTDRVFYTRLDCLNTENDITSSMFIGIIDDMSDEIYNEVYPFKSCVISLTEE